VSADLDALMRVALDEARAALEHDDVPVGAAVARLDTGEILARRHNEREQLDDPTAHAEVLALRDAARARGSWRLDGCILVVTLEPCPMCAAAIYWSGIGRVVFALGAGTFREVAGVDDRLELSCREVLARGTRVVEVSGPHLEEEAADVHEGYW